MTATEAARTELLELAAANREQQKNLPPRTYPSGLGVDFQREVITFGEYSFPIPFYEMKPFEWHYPFMKWVMTLELLVDKNQALVDLAQLIRDCWWFMPCQRSLESVHMPGE